MVTLTPGSLEDVLEALRESRIKADREVTDEKLAQAGTGSFFFRAEPTWGIIIYGEIIEPSYEEDRALYTAPHMKFVRFTKCYSQIVPEGELGNTHIASMQGFMTLVQFQLIAQHNWPASLEELQSLVSK